MALGGEATTWTFPTDPTPDRARSTSPSCNKYSSTLAGVVSEGRTRAQSIFPARSPTRTIGNSPDGDAELDQPSRNSAASCNSIVEAIVLGPSAIRILRPSAVVGHLPTRRPGQCSPVPGG